MSRFTIPDSNLARIADLSERMYSYEAFFHMSPLLCCIASRTHLLVVNQPWDILGYDFDELLSIPHVELLHPDDIKDTINALKIMEDWPLTNYINRYRKKDGSYLGMKATCSKWDGNDVTYVIVRPFELNPDGSFDVNQ